MDVNQNDDSNSTPQVSCTAWCAGTLEHIDAIFPKISQPSEEVFLELARQQGLITSIYSDHASSSSSSSPVLHVQLDEYKLKKSLHDLAQLLSCQGLLAVRMTHNGFSQHDYTLFLNYLSSAMLHLEESLRKSSLTLKKDHLN